MLKLCIKCEFYKHIKGCSDIDGEIKAIEARVCENENCKHIVTGTTIYCIEAREKECYCGIVGKYYKEKEDA